MNVIMKFSILLKCFKNSRNSNHLATNFVEIDSFFKKIMTSFIKEVFFCLLLLIKGQSFIAYKLKEREWLLHSFFHKNRIMIFCNPKFELVQP